jgi:hypothetical protein
LSSLIDQQGISLILFTGGLDNERQLRALFCIKRGIHLLSRPQCNLPAQQITGSGHIGCLRQAWQKYSGKQHNSSAVFHGSCLLG